MPDGLTVELLTGAGINSFLALVVFKLWADLKTAHKSRVEHLEADVERLQNKLDKYEMSALIKSSPSETG
jgi:hypothetical protein